MAGTSGQSITQSWVQMMSSELNSLANDSGVAQNTSTNAAYANGASAVGQNYGEFECRVTFSSAPNAGATLDLYVLPLSSDNSTYTTFGTVPPPGCFMGSFVVQAVTSLQILSCRPVGPLPDGTFTVALFNNATGQSLPSGTLVKFRPVAGAYT